MPECVKCHIESERVEPMFMKDIPYMMLCPNCTRVVVDNKLKEGKIEDINQFNQGVQAGR